mmetsp:Transcript_17830/g.55785  ORF Transcript_17830/g.55785 Transcript_17830/m.55785 type:complete len:209 (-) Transcript_17830:1000-1626(-)
MQRPGPLRAQRRAPGPRRRGPPALPSPMMPTRHLQSPPLSRLPPLPRQRRPTTAVSSVAASTFRTGFASATRSARHMALAVGTTRRRAPRRTSPTPLRSRRSPTVAGSWHRPNSWGRIAGLSAVTPRGRPAWREPGPIHGRPLKGSATASETLTAPTSPTTPPPATIRARTGRLACGRGPRRRLAGARRRLRRRSRASAPASAHSTLS